MPCKRITRYAVTMTPALLPLNKSTLRPIRSFVCRQKKLSENQQYAIDFLSKPYLLSHQPLHFKKTFQHEASIILEIGFGMGNTLLQQANEYPQNNYLGIEVYRPGIARVLTQIEKLQLKNIRIIWGDAVEILRNIIPEHSLDKVQIFFPDPWPKTRHHKRRLIQAEFVNLLHKKLKLNSLLHLTTDWKNYADHILKILESAKGWENPAGESQFMQQPTQRFSSKYEQHALQRNVPIWDLVFRTNKK